MTEPLAQQKLNRHYLYDENTMVIYYTTNGENEEVPTDNNLIYLGTSDNPKPRVAAAFFMRDSSAKTGFSIKPYVEGTLV